MDAQQLRDQALQRAQNEADLAQRRFMMVDPANRLVADSLESDWNEKLRALAAVREEGERARSQDDIEINDAVSNRLVTMCTDFKQLWSDPSTPNRERKRMLAYLIEDVTLMKMPVEQCTKIHIRFRGGETGTLSAENPLPSWKKVQTPQAIVNLVDRLLDDHIYAQIADILNERGLQPGGAAWPGRGDTRFTTTRVRYIVTTYHLRPRFDRLRERGLLTRKELADRLEIHEYTLSQWVKRGIIKAHAYNGHAWLFEEPLTYPKKHSSRWDCLENRAAATYASDTTQNP